MTKALKKAFEAASRLPDQEQDELEEERGSGLAFMHCPLDSAALSDHLLRPDVGLQDLTPD